MIVCCTVPTVPWQLLLGSTVAVNPASGFVHPCADNGARGSIKPRSNTQAAIRYTPLRVINLGVFGQCAAIQAESHVFFVITGKKS